MSELTVVDILIEPDDVAVERAREVNRRMPLSIDAAFVTDPGEQISQTVNDCAETYVSDQTGANYTAHLTVGLITVHHLKALQAEPFDAFDVRPLSLAVYQPGNNGTARSLLKDLAA